MAMGKGKKDKNNKKGSKDPAASEEAAYKKREEESAAAGVPTEIRPPRGGDPPPPGRWQWTLNWDPVVLNDAGEATILVGSCPKTPADVRRLKEEAGVEAILSLQSDVCLEAMGVAWDEVTAEAADNDILYVRVPVFDFDRIDQANMLPEMVRRLASLQRLGRRTYVHCSAGINRANLTVLGYLTFVQGMPLDAAVDMIREARPQANPYVDCWRMSRNRLLAMKEHDMYLATQVKGNSIEEGGDWIMRDWDAASTQVIMDYYNRSVDSDIQLLTAFQLLTDVELAWLNAPKKPS